MAPWYSKERLTRSGQWKLLAVSVSAAGLIGLLCGLCESSTKHVCTNMITGIASLLSPTEAKTNAPSTNTNKDITSLMITRSTTTTLETSSNAYAAIIRKKFGTFTAANMATRISDLTTMPVCLTAHLTTASSISKTKALLPMKALLYKISGHTVSVPSGNLIMKPLLTRPDIYSKKSLVIGPSILIYATTNTALPIGLNPHTLQ